VSAAAASPHAAASRAGAEVLAAGGSAMDAAVAINAVLCVVYPHMCGLAGDLFMLYRDASDGRVWALNGSGPAPALATREWFRARGLSEVPARGPLPVTVPGAVASWAAGLERFGRRPLAELLEPAARAAEDGFAVTARTAGWIAHNASALALDPVLRDRYLDPDGAAIAGGTVVRQPDLARTLRRLAEAGAADLYRGALAAEIDAALRAADGLLRREDLAAFAPEWVEPVRLRYRGLDVLTTPPNSQGVTALMMLSALVELDPPPPGTAGHVEALVAAKRFAFAARDRHVADPRFADVPLGDLLSPDFARAGLAAADPGPVRSSAGDTVYLCAVDADGNACSMIESIYYGFGSCFVAGDTGLLMHNRGHYFSLDDDHANRLEPGKRPLHTLMATMAFAGDDLRLVFGCMGADGQAQTTVQVLERYLAGTSVAEAVSAPRILHGRFVPEDDPEELKVEAPFGEEAIAALRAAGHHPVVVGEHAEHLGHAHAIELRVDGTLVAASDPRSDGAAIVLD
jgi:gamma-glutamyltranspeptidase/glutathione hydrolase